MHPPRKALAFLRWFCREDYLEEIEGDLVEVFGKEVESSPRKAKWKFSWSVIKYFRPGFIKSFKSSYTTNNTAMFQHNFLITYRNFLRNKSSFFINLTGLSTALACSLLIYLWVADELGYDNFHVNNDRLYQVMANHNKPQGISTFSDTPGLLAEALSEEITGVASAVSTSGVNVEQFSLKAGDNRMNSFGLFGSEDFFKLFSYEIIHGVPKLNDKDAIVISEFLAKRLFGNVDNVLGKEIDWEIWGIKHQGFVSAIYKDVPENSSIQFDFVLPFNFYKENIVENSGWNNNYATTYILLNEGTPVDFINEKVLNFMKSKQSDTNITLFLQSYSDRYLYGTYENGMVSGGRISYVKLFSIIAIFVLIIACINFMNLSTARASRRIKEVGIKKAIGANSNSLISQFLVESVLISFISLFFAVVLVAHLLPQFNLITGKQLLLQ